MAKFSGSTRNIIEIVAGSESDAFTEVSEQFPDAGGYILRARRNRFGGFSLRGHHFTFEVLPKGKPIDLGEDEY
jgi:hypothetical protein